MTFTIKEVMDKIRFIEDAIVTLNRGGNVDKDDLIDILSEYNVILYDGKVHYKGE